MKNVALVVVALVGLAGQARAQVTYFGQTGNVSIPASGVGAGASGIAEAYPISFNVGSFGIVSDVRVRLTTLVHPRPQDLDIVLCSPNGTCTTIMSDAGGTSAMNATLTFQTGATPLDQSATPVTGTVGCADYSPNDSMPVLGNVGDAILDLFRGQEQRGFWGLYILDDLDLGSNNPPFHDGSRGSLVSASLIITTTATANQRPVLNAALSPTLTAINEDAVINGGNLLIGAFGILGGSISDPDPWAVLGIAVTGAAGGFEYSRDNGTTWLGATGLSDTNALLIPLNAYIRVRYNPPANFNGLEPAVFRFRAWDRTTGGDFALASVSSLGTAVSTVDDTVAITVNPVNDPPAIAFIADQTELEDTNHQVFLPVSDLETTPTVTASHSSPSLIQSLSVTPGVNPTLTIVPVLNATGTAAINVVASDGALTANRSFNITFQGVNDAPTVSVPATSTTQEDLAANIPLTVGDVETAAGSLTGSATATNTTLFPAGSLTVSNNSGMFTLVMTPAANANGTSDFTVTISDGQATAQATGSVTVTAVNDPPVISTNPSANVTEDVAYGPANISISDVDDNVDTLTVTGTASPHGTVMTGGTGGTRTYTFLTGQDQTGASTITLTVQDSSGASATAEVAVTVTPVNDPPVFAPISAQSVSEDNSVTIPFTVTDVDSVISTLVYSASTDVATLVDGLGVSVNGTTMPGMITVTPRPNQTGNVNITISALDDGVTGSVTFGLNVSSVDDPPTITPPAGATLPMTVASTLNFTVTDVDSSTAALTFTATSSNDTLYPAGSFTFGGSGDNRTITLTPLAGQPGNADITIAAVGLAVTAQFHVVVQDGVSSSGGVTSGGGGSSGGNSSGMAGSSRSGNSGGGSSSTMASGGASGGGSSGIITASSGTNTSGGTSTGGGDDGGDKGGCNSLAASNGSMPFAVFLLGLVAVAARRRRR